MFINIPKDIGAPDTMLPGNYKVVCSAVKAEKAKSSDNMIIKPEFTVQSQTDAEGKKIAGRKLFDNWTVTDQCVGIWNSGYKALTGHDLPAGQFTLEQFIERVCQEVVNKECLVQTDNEVFEEVARTKIKKYMAIGG